MSTAKKSTLFMVSGLLGVPYSVAAITINVEMQGEGTVTSEQANVQCSESCTITNTLETNTLSAKGGDGWIFDKWEGQKCDAGSGVLVDTSTKTLDAVDGGAKTVAHGDFNGDGLSDFATLSLFDGTLKLLMNEGNGTYNKSTVEQGLNYPSAMDIADWDNDGDADLIVAVFGLQKLRLYQNDGAGLLTHSHDIGIPGVRPYAVSVADINGDGLPDLLISSFEADIEGNLSQLVGSIKNARTAWYTDVNGQFEESIVVSQNAAITLDTYRNEMTSATIAVAAEIADTEVALYTIKDGVARTVLATGGRPYGAAFGDIDDDGHQDVLVADYAPASLSILMNNSTGGYLAPRELIKTQEGLTATAIADVNGDELKDVVTGEFNRDRFFYLPTKSYEKCVVHDTADISITATFKQAEQTSPAPAPAPPSTPPTNEQSSGGSLFYGLFLLLAAFGFRRLTKLSQQISYHSQ